MGGREEEKKEEEDDDERDIGRRDPFQKTSFPGNLKEMMKIQQEDFLKQSSAGKEVSKGSKDEKSSLLFPVVR